MATVRVDLRTNILHAVVVAAEEELVIVVGVRKTILIINEEIRGRDIIPGIEDRDVITSSTSTTRVIDPVHPPLRIHWNRCAALAIG